VYHISVFGSMNIGHSARNFRHETEKYYRIARSLQDYEI